ncbi:sensor histidine kinase [Planosporangium mesophilum]|uniref:histidine kinase n=1 Tax=Planosporangium mesophilum TaxID=689768 RepID=A0A8J3T8G3_9ACTN|nr:CHASE3 domain-containing protein [Planosporangium mesophilum]NJC81361.1 HAMP domain-containing protein [Planosporangium mesophilum]GII20986.1 histidine kinase [Planosporangium mesophilum]
MVRHWTLSRRVTALCAVVVLLLGALATGATATAETSRSHVTELLDRIGPLRTDSERLLTALVDQETGVRGFALSGTERLLAPYPAGIAEQRRLIAEMRGLTRDRTVLTQLDAVDAQAEAWRAEVAEPAISAARAGDSTAAQSILSEPARARFDQIRASATALQDRIIAVRAAAADRIQAGQKRVMTLLLLAAIVVLVAGLALAVLLRQLVTRPVVTLAGEVRRVARGEYDREIKGAGPPELARLARDINAMRQQIVADLGTVRRAHVQVEQANQLLEQQAAELTRSNRDLEQFAYVASHDLQEPLRKVASFCQLLQRRYAGQLDERADQYIAFAVDGAQRMQRLINDLLAFSRIGRITSGFTEVDLDRVVSEAAAQLNWRSEQVDASVTWSGLPTVRGEEPLLSALFTNLISNSLKFRHPDRSPHVRIEAERVGDEWQISCADNGIGIEPEYADKIFVIFQRLHPKNEYPGTGIGLAIVKKIIEYHGGRVWLDAEAEEGTVIRFALPATADEPVSPAATGQPELIPAAAEAARTEETAP